MCGRDKLKPKITEEELYAILDSRVETNDEFGICTSVIISDRYALTAAHCQESLLSLHRRDYDPALNTQAVRFRDGTKNEEIIGVRRHWINPWRLLTCTTSNVYYDLTIIELGNFYFLLSDQ